MALNKKTDYFISQKAAILRVKPNEKAEPVNHVIYGDWLRWLGETKGAWEKVRCRGDEGWIRAKEFDIERVLEVNFVDIGQGDGCHIVLDSERVPDFMSR